MPNIRHILCILTLTLFANPLHAQQELPEIGPQPSVLPAWKAHLENGGDLEAPDKNGNTLLMLAVSRRNPELAKYLVQKGANVNARNKVGRTPLMFAASQAIEICQYLLDHGADMEATDDDLLTPVHYALGYEDKGCTSGTYSGKFDCPLWLLLEKGIDINARTKKGENALYLAVDNPNCDEHFIAKMLEMGAEVNVRTMPNWETPLFKALQHGNTDICMMLLDHGAEVRIYDSRGRLPIFYAAEFWDSKLIDKFLEKGATLRDLGRDGNTLLFAVAKVGDIELAKRVLDAGVDINAYNISGLTALICALEKNKQEMVKFLLERGATLEERKDRHQSDHDFFVYAALQNAVSRGDLELCKDLVRHGARFLDRPADAQKFLTCAVNNGDVNLCRYILNFNPDINVFSWNSKLQYAALHTAALHMKYDICVFLLSQKADINLKNRHGCTPLLFAVVHHQPVSGSDHMDAPGDRRLQRIVQTFIDMEADVDARDINRKSVVDYLFMEKYACIPFTRKYFTLRTGIYKNAQAPDPFLMAAYEGDLNRVKTLLESGTDIGMKDADNETALHFAIRGNRKEVCEYLLEKGADLHAPGLYVATPLHYAASLGMPELVTLLADKGADMNRPDTPNRATPLHWAVESSQGTCLQTLVKKGADMEALDRFNITAFCLALENRKESYCRYFCKNGFDINRVVRNCNFSSILPHLKTRDVLKLLKELGMDYNTQSRSGKTLLHELQADPELVHYLLENGADPTSRDNEGNPPSFYKEHGLRNDKYKNRILRAFGQTP